MKKIQSIIFFLLLFFCFNNTTLKADENPDTAFDLLKSILNPEAYSSLTSKELEEILKLLLSGDEIDRKKLNEILKKISDKDIETLIQLIYTKNSYNEVKPLIAELLANYTQHFNMSDKSIKIFQGLFETLPEEVQKIFITKSTIAVIRNYEDIEKRNFNKIKPPSFYFFQNLDYKNEEVKKNFYLIIEEAIEKTGVFDPKLMGTIVMDEPSQKMIKNMLYNFLIRLHPDRIAEKLVDQLFFQPTSPEKENGERLLILMANIPTFQKIGQILARNPMIPPKFKIALQELEDNLKRQNSEDYHERIVNELRKKHKNLKILNKPSNKSEPMKVELNSKSGEKITLTIAATPLAAGTVGEAIPFAMFSKGKEKMGIFKILKPKIRGYIEEEFSILSNLLNEYKTESLSNNKEFNLEELFSGEIDVKELASALASSSNIHKLLKEAMVFIKNEVNVEKEKKNFQVAYNYFSADKNAKAPELYCPQLCSDDLTAMEFMKGEKISKITTRSSPDNDDQAERKFRSQKLVRAFILNALFHETEERKTLFHGDPHAGNILFDTTKAQVNFVDWGLMDYLSREQRLNFLLLYMSVEFNDRYLLLKTIKKISSNWKSRFSTLRSTSIFTKNIYKILDYLFTQDEYTSNKPFLVATILCLALKDGLNLSKELSLFAKSIFTLDNVLKDLDPNVFNEPWLKKELILKTVQVYPELMPKGLLLAISSNIIKKDNPTPEEAAKKLFSDH